MVLPTHTSIELPLLKVLSDNRDQLTAAEAIDKVTTYFPEITPDDLTKEMNPPWGGNFWRNRVRWARQALVGYQFGIFVATSNFTGDAVDAAERSGKVKLVNGKELAELLIKYGLGVSKTPYELPRIDQDFFESI
jgi:hypothetical protein